MIITHVDYYKFPNTPEGRSKAEFWESVIRRMGYKALKDITTMSITVGYEETIAFKPPELEVMREPDDKGVE